MIGIIGLLQRKMHLGVITLAMTITACGDAIVDQKGNTKSQAIPATLTSVPVTVEHSHAAIQLQASDRLQYGGFSALWLSKDCSQMISFSDYSQVRFFSLDGQVKRSGWIQANLSFDANDKLTGFNLVDQGQLKDADGDLLSGAAESLAWDGSGFLVSFDDKGDLYRYAGVQPQGALFNQLPEISIKQERLGKDNAGLESITELPDGRVLALWEKNDKQKPVTHGQLIQPDGQSLQFSYSSDANPGAATTLPDDSFVIAERKYKGPEQGVQLRLTRFLPSDIQADKLLTPQVLLDHTSISYDNFEGIANCQRNGKQWLFVLSDDNGDWPESWVEGKGRQRQKTLLVQFDLTQLMAQ